MSAELAPSVTIMLRRRAVSGTGDQLSDVMVAAVLGRSGRRL